MFKEVDENVASRMKCVKKGRAQMDILGMKNTVNEMKTYIDKFDRRLDRKLVNSVIQINRKHPD